MVCLVQVQPASYVVERLTLFSLCKGDLESTSLPILRSCSLRLPQDPRIHFPWLLHTKVHAGRPLLLEGCGAAGMPPFSSSRGRSDPGGSAYPPRNLVQAPIPRGVSPLPSRDWAAPSVGVEEVKEEARFVPPRSARRRPAGARRIALRSTRRASTAWSAWAELLGLTRFPARRSNPRRDGPHQTDEPPPWPPPLRESRPLSPASSAAAAAAAAPRPLLLLLAAVPGWLPPAA